MSIAQVAKLAGVSSSTVSRVMNNRPRVAPETERAVREAIHQLAYQPSDRRPGPKPAAHKTVRGSIGLFVLGASEGGATPGFMGLLRGISSGAYARNFSLTFEHIPDPIQLHNRLHKQNLDGLILHGNTFDAPEFSPLRHMPCVWVMGNRVRPTWGDIVMPDPFQIGQAAADYLVGSGHPHMAYINLDEEHWVLNVCGHAFAQAVRLLGRSTAILSRKRPPLRDYWDPYGDEAIREVVTEFAGLSPRPTGICIADSMQAALVQPALIKRGLMAQTDGAHLIVCNREEPYLMGLAPAPAAVDVHFESIGRQAVQQLIWRCECMKMPERVTRLVSPQLSTFTG